MIEVLILVVTFLWSVMWVAKKYLIRDVDCATVYFWERMVLLLFLFSYMVISDLSFSVSYDAVFYAALSGLCFTLLNALNFKLLRQIEVSSMSAIKELSKLFLGVAVGIAVFGETPTGFQVAGLLIVGFGAQLMSKLSGREVKVRLYHIGIAAVLMIFFQGKMVFEKFALADMEPVQFVFYMILWSSVFTAVYMVRSGKSFDFVFSRKRVPVLFLSGFLLAVSLVVHGFVLRDGSFILVNIFLTSSVVFNFLSSQAARSFFGVDTEASNDGKTIIGKFAASVVVMAGLIVALM